MVVSQCHATWMLGLASSLLVQAPAPAANPMLDPGVDGPGGEWSYMAKPTTVIGVPYQPAPVQVTFDGAVFTGQAELCLFVGEPPRPILARQRHFADGWMPIVEYEWRTGDLQYRLDLFGMSLDGEDETNTVQFVRLRARNVGRSTEAAHVAAALRHTGGDHRFGSSAFSPDWPYEMRGGLALRDDKVVYVFPTGARLESVDGAPYRGPFAGRDYHVTPRAEVCLARYERLMRPGQELELCFRMPRVPVDLSDAAFVSKLVSADHDVYRRKTVSFWKELFRGAAEFDIPEARVRDAQRASLVHLLLATRQRDGQCFQTSGLLYPSFFMIDYVDQGLAYDLAGLPDHNRLSLRQILARQEDDGLFLDTSLIHGVRSLSSHGQSLFGLAHHYIVTRDAEYGRSVYPAVRRAVEWMRVETAKDPKGLMPESWPYDAEMIRGHYTSHSLWGLLALRAAVQLARGLGEAEDADRWLAFHEQLQASVMAAIEATAGDAGYVPTGLFGFLTGDAARAGFPEYTTNQDWENLLLAYPTEVLAPGDPRVRATLERMHRAKYREGIMTYRNGMHLHQYLTTNVTNQHILRGEQRQALTDLYHMLLHCGPTHEGFENMVEPWTDRDTSDWPPPHAWAAAKIANLIRNCLVVEHGGRAGLYEGRRDLHLFSVVSPVWAEPGRTLGFRDAVTEMGTVSASMRFPHDGAEEDQTLRLVHLLGQFGVNGKRPTALPTQQRLPRGYWLTADGGTQARVVRELLRRAQHTPGDEWYT